MPDLKTIGNIIDVGLDILSTVRDAVTNTIKAQLGDVVGEVGESDDAEWWQHVGFASRPPKPQAGKKATQGIIYRHSQRDVCFASRDVRGQTIYGALDHGETCVYAGGENGTAQGRILLKKNGGVAMYTLQGNAAGGQSVTVQANADGSVVMACQYGAFTINSDGIKAATNGGAGFQFGTDGKVAIIGTEIALNAGAVSLGANATMPVVWGPLGISGVGSTSVKVAV